MEELLDVAQLNIDCEQLLSYWNEYGHGSDQLEKRKRTVGKYTKELFRDMVVEEEKRIAEKKAEIEGLRAEVKQLSTQLDIEYDETKSTAENLLATVEILEKLKIILIKTKGEKMQDWMIAKKTEDELCVELGEQSTVDILDRIPTRAEVADLNARIKHLKLQKQKRTAQFHELSTKVRHYLDVLELDPSTPIDRSLATQEIILTTKFLGSATARKNELENEYTILQSKWKVMLEQVQGLWKRLEIVDVIDFGPEPRPTAFEKIKAEHSRLLVLKKANLKTFITKLRIEIEAIATASYRKVVLPVEIETDECLEEHEALLNTLQNYKQEHTAILDLIEKRKDVFNKWKECEMKADDPSRFNNRGGNLLKEEKLRKQLQKSLPKMDKELEESEFLMWDVKLKDWLQTEWAEWNQLKEDIKKKKKEEAAAASSTPYDMNTTRKRPATPLMGQTNKRTRGTPLTPRKNPIVLDPASTYTDFQSHNIFQSTMNKGDGSKSPNPKIGSCKSPLRVPHPPGNIMSNIKKGGAGTTLKFTTPKTTRLNENF